LFCGEPTGLIYSYIFKTIFRHNLNIAGSSENNTSHKLSKITCLGGSKDCDFSLNATLVFYKITFDVSLKPSSKIHIVLLL